MTKVILILGILFTQVTLINACDICGCASSSFSMGLLPSSKHHFIGIRSSIKNFESREIHALSTRFDSEQHFSTTEIFGRYKISNKFQVLATVPYIYNVKKDSISTLKIDGIGDPILLFNYVFVDNTDSLTKKFKQSGTIGIGVKFPLGSFYKLGFSEINMLPGTGSFDFISNLNYSLQYRSYGLQNETSFTLKTANKYLYQFGNAFSSSNMLFYRWVVNDNLKIVPQIGVNYNFNWEDIKNGKKSEDTFNGGAIINSQFNLFVIYKNFGLNINMFLPLNQELNQGYVRQKNSFRVALNYFINEKSKRK
jgi:hypothetical protein